jgi:GWxTD domain-containing protein
MRSSVLTMLRLLAVALVVLVVPAADAGTSLKGWRDGPVSDLLTADEYRQFGELRTDAARQTFIDGFWRGIDGPTGGSADSYRETFEQRCRAADDRFRTGFQHGSRTDRGRVYLALGEPAGIQHEGGGVRAVEKEVWTYDGLSESEPPLRIAFFRCLDGTYRLDPSCAAERDPNSVAYDEERAEFLRRLRIDRRSFGGDRTAAMLSGLLVPVPGGVPLSPGTASRLGRAPETLAAGSATAPRSLDVHALENATYFFRAKDGTILTLLTLELLASRDGAGSAPPAGLSSTYLGAASVEETGRRGEDLPETAARAVALDAAQGRGKDGTANFFGRIYLEPGRTYAVRYAVKDGPRDEIFVRSALLGVPNLGRGFSASSIVPAEQFGPAGPGAGKFQVGSEEVVPKAGGVFRRSELLRLYLQVYDAAIAPETLMPRVDVVFKFYRPINGTRKRYGKPCSVRGAVGASMGLALPIGDWPTGPYRVVVELHDRVSDARTTTEGSFSIVAE